MRALLAIAFSLNLVACVTGDNEADLTEAGELADGDPRSALDVDEPVVAATDDLHPMPRSPAMEVGDTPLDTADDVRAMPARPALAVSDAQPDGPDDLHGRPDRPTMAGGDVPVKLLRDLLD